MTDADLLELLNGAAIVPGFIVIGLLFRYLVKEAQRRGLHGLDWRHFPPSMNLVLAMFIFVVAVWGEKVFKWGWRFFGAKDFGAGLTVFLIFFGSFVVIGSLCKIRALTRPDFGDGPWLISASLSAVAIVALVVFR